MDQRGLTPLTMDTLERALRALRADPDAEYWAYRIRCLEREIAGRRARTPGGTPIPPRPARMPG